MNTELPAILHALLLAHGKPLSVTQLQALLAPEQLDAAAIHTGLEQLQQQLTHSPVQLEKVASGYRLHIHSRYNRYIERLWDERPPRYSRALLETLALIAYRQPITRGEIEEVRGVAVSSQIMRTLVDREWVRIVGHREVPGRPAMYATTRQFLDYFNLRSLAELPPLAALREPSEVLEGPALQEQLERELPEQEVSSTEESAPPADAPAGRDFHALLEELNAMETNIKTDFDDLPLPGSEPDQPQPEDD